MKLKKEFYALMDDRIADYWEGEWQDAATGARMWGRGVEIWVMRGGKIAVWEAAFNTNKADQSSAMDIMNVEAVRIETGLNGRPLAG